jgi:hypothetical protein
MTVNREAVEVETGGMDLIVKGGLKRNVLVSGGPLARGPWSEYSNQCYNYEGAWRSWVEV